MHTQTVAATETRGNQGPCASVSTWHCVYTKASKELACDSALKRQGYESYLPLYEVVWRDRTKIIRPLFPRYTFVRFSADAAWRSVIRDSVGQEVGTLMLSLTSRRPLVVPDAVIQSLQSQAEADGVIYPTRPRELQAGDMGRVISGPLAEFSGICARAARDRVWLLLTMFGREQTVPFRREDVEIAA